MKNVFRIIAIGLVGTFIFASCNKSNTDDYDKIIEEQKKEQARIDSTLKAQKSILEEFAKNPANGFVNPKLDTASGIWYDLKNAGTADSYTYSINSYGLVPATATIKYEGKLLNGTSFDNSLTESKSFTVPSKVITAWGMAFFPKTITMNGTVNNIGGILPKGLQKGAKIKFVAPSPYCYDKSTLDKIPANSPLVFDIEVVDIK